MWWPQLQNQKKKKNFILNDYTMKYSIIPFYVIILQLRNWSAENNSFFFFFLLIRPCKKKTPLYHLPLTFQSRADRRWGDLFTGSWAHDAIWHDSWKQFQMNTAPRFLASNWITLVWNNLVVFKIKNKIKKESFVFLFDEKQYLTWKNKHYIKRQQFKLKRLVVWPLGKRIGQEMRLYPHYL